MDFFETVNQRQSIRRFKNQPVEPEKLEQLLATANKAPSAGNLQAYSIVVVTGPAIKHELVSITDGQEFVEEAPVVLVFCAEPERSASRYSDRGTTLYSIQDATIACAHVQLAATALGLGSTWVGKFNDDALRQLLGLAEALKPVAILPIGYPDETPAKKSRRNLSELVIKR